MQVERKPFLAALRKVAPAVASRGQIPAYSGVHLATNSEGVEVRSTNGDMAISSRCATQNGDPLEAIVPHSILSAFVGSADGDVILRMDADELVVISAGASIRLRTLPLDDWPTTPTLSNPTGFGPDVFNAARWVSYAASKDDARPILTCVQIADGWVVATDSYRLAAHKVDADGAALVPSAGLHATDKAFDAVPMFQADDRRIAFSDDQTSIMVRRIEGQFPSWRALVPASCEYNVSTDREALLHALRRCNVLRDADQPPVRISHHATGLTLELVSRDVGTFSETLSAETKEFPSIAVRPGYLIEAIEHGDGDTVALEFDSASKPMKIRDGDERVSLVMPVRVS